jgi:hypothetical protein
MAVYQARHYNVGQATNIGFINIISNALGALIVFTMSPLLGQQEGIDLILAIAIYTALLIVALVLMLFVK